MKRVRLALASTVAAVLVFSGDARADPEGQPCAAEPTDELVEYGDLRTCSISPVGESDLFRFVGATNEIVQIVGKEGDGFSGSADVCLDVRRPDGSQLVQQCGEVSTLIEVTLVETGEYIVRIFESGNDQVMNYTLDLERVFPLSPNGTSLETGVALSGQTISPSGDVDTYVFQGVSGSLIRLDSTEGDGFSGSPDVCLDLRRPDGSRVGSVICGEVAADIETTLDQTGLYTVLVYEAGYDQGMTFSIVHTCLLGSCPSAARPRCEMDLSETAYTAGEVVTIQTLRLVNPAGTPVNLRLWFEVPGYSPVPTASTAIPAGFDQTYGPLPFFTVLAEFPLGTYGVGCRMLSTVTGETLQLDLNPFELQ